MVKKVKVNFLHGTMLLFNEKHMMLLIGRTPKLKDVFGSFLLSIDFFYIYIYYRKVNVEFNKLIITVRHRARFWKNDVEHTHLCQQF